MTVNVLDFDYVPTDRYHGTFHLREDAIGRLLTDLLEVHFVGLRKLKAPSVDLERRLVRWMLFLTTKTREGLEELAMQKPAIQKALTTLEFLSQDEPARQLYAERQKALMTYTADVEGAREEGEHQRAVSTARKMLVAGMDVEQIAEFVDLSVDEVEAVRQDFN
ncbi:MAG: Rpn family recombination-promoting nuclease/putative transposase [Thermaerobacter sp.]|nr:Rpn family recombination-promoting nuclease/putative transposase [Thermaerobacter sp.]